MGSDHGLQQGGFAPAGAAQNADGLPYADLEGDPLEDLHVAEVLDEVLDLDRDLRLRVFCRRLVVGRRGRSLVGPLVGVVRHYPASGWSIVNSLVR